MQKYFKTYREQCSEQIQARVAVLVPDHVHLGRKEVSVSAHLENVHNLTKRKDFNKCQDKVLELNTRGLNRKWRSWYSIWPEKGN